MVVLVAVVFVVAVVFTVAVVMDVVDVAAVMWLLSYLLLFFFHSSNIFRCCVCLITFLCYFIVISMF